MADEQKSGSADLAVYEAVRAHELMHNEATAAFEHAVLAPLFLLNGGAAVAFVTLIGAASGGSSSLSIRNGWATTAVVLWIAGLLAAAAATWWGFKVQQGFSVAERLRRQNIEGALPGLSPHIRQLTRDDENTGKEAWAKRRPPFELLIVLSVICFSFGAGFAAYAIAG